MRRKQSRQEKINDKRIERIYGRACSGVQINVMDIGSVFAVGHRVIAAGADDVELEKAIVAYVDTIRKN